MLPRLVRYGYLPHVVQVFLEDMAIGVLFVRLGALVGRPWLPAPIAGVFFVLQRSRDIPWFFPVHFVMDMSQYASISGVAASG